MNNQKIDDPVANKKGISNGVKDYTLTAVAGILTGLLIIPIISNLGYGFSYSIIILPGAVLLLFEIGMIVAKFIGRSMLWFFQLAKFAATGFLNAAIDFGILNFLIFTTGIASGIGFSTFKAGSFIVANLNGFVWSRYWVFGSRNKITKEYLQFFLVSIIGISLNVGSASIVVNGIAVQFGLSPQAWANIGAAVGAAVGLIWNFLGYKFIVFKA
ncbi:GtrA family protein [Patescibacteria group bacterium]|nr:GtrA family protein [Patescibacteria group bacterium]